MGRNRNNPNAGDVQTFNGTEWVPLSFLQAIAAAGFILLVDALIYFIDDIDNTKRAQFQLSGLSTGATRILTLLDSDITVAGSSGAMTAGRMVYTIAGGLLAASANGLWDGTNFDLSAGAGTFKTPTGAVTINGIATFAATGTTTFNDGSLLLNGATTAAASHLSVTINRTGHTTASNRLLLRNSGSTDNAAIGQAGSAADAAIAWATADTTYIYAPTRFRVSTGTAATDYFEVRAAGVVHAGTGTFSTGTGTVSLNGPTTINPGVAASALTITQGTITSAAVFPISTAVTWNAAVTFTGWKLNVTDTSSNAASLLADLQVAGVSRFNIRKDGLATIAGVTATTASSDTLLYIANNTSGTAAAGYGSTVLYRLKSDTTADQNAAKIDTTWVVATHASRTVRQVYNIYDSVGGRECLRLEANGTAAMIGFLGAAAVAQQALTVDHTDVLTNFGLQASGGGKIKVWRKILTGVNVNSAATDVGTFSNLPAKYRVVRLQAFDGSISLTTGTLDLRTATAGAGTALVAAASMAACTAAAKYSDLALAAVATTDYQTTATLTARNVTAQGAAATVSLLLEVIDLT